MATKNSNAASRVTIGIVIGAVVVSALWFFIPQPIPPPADAPLCEDPPGTYHTVTFTLETGEDPPVVTVNPEITEKVQQCDVVVFVNKTGQEAIVDFSEAAGGIGTPFNDEVKFTIQPEGHEDGYTRAPQVIVEAPVGSFIDYKYTVTVGDAVFQSPVIRIGPKD